MGEKKGILSGRSILVVLIAIIAGVAFLLVGKDGEEVKAENDDSMAQAAAYRDELERTAASMCASLKGIETAQVNITLEGGMTCVYAKNSEGSYGGTYFSSGGDPLFLKYDYPSIVGCAVVCSGALNSEAKLELTRMMSAYLGIPSSKIYVGYKE